MTTLFSGLLALSLSTTAVGTHDAAIVSQSQLDATNHTTVAPVPDSTQKPMTPMEWIRANRNR